ncbi:MAG: OmpA family protein [Agriterribacter sp.]
MKKVYVLLTFGLFTLNILQAQIKVGAGIGVHNASIIESNSLQNWNNQYKGYFSPLGGIHGGVFAELPVGKDGHWAVQGSLIYTNKGNKFAKSYDSTKTFNSDTSSILASVKMNHLELPLNMIYRLPISQKVHFIIGAGGYVGYNIKGKSTYDLYNASGEHTTVENRLGTEQTLNSFNKLDYGVNGVAGLDFNDRVMLTLHYTRGLADLYKASYDGSFKNQAVGATLVVWVTKSKTAKIKESVKDTDGDGVPDKDDKCSGESGTAATNGCPDKDGDGIPDKEDKCADVAGLTKYAGCPAPDADKDGVSDENDKCPDVAGLVKYNGCPAPDTDKDGINDENDKCPDQSGTAKHNGCPVPDTDMDGINDEEDKCPTKAGSAQNSGCPVLENNLIDEINKAAHNILFDVNSDNIKVTSYTSLDRVAEIMLKNEGLKMDIEGHTDNTGSVRHNQVLSGKRALAIKIYLVNKGVSHERLTASGYGSEHPIADNNTEAGRAKNRRVAFKVSY